MLHARRLAGASVFRGIEGYGASTPIRRTHHLSFSHDTPVMVSISESRRQNSKAFAIPRRHG
jgi:uncharacterized protein